MTTNTQQNHSQHVLVKLNQMHWTGETVAIQYFNTSPTCAPVKHIQQATVFYDYDSAAHCKKTIEAAREFSIMRVDELPAAEVGVSYGAKTFYEDGATSRNVRFRDDVIASIQKPKPTRSNQRKDTVMIVFTSDCKNYAIAKKLDGKKFFSFECAQRAIVEAVAERQGDVVNTFGEKFPTMERILIGDVNAKDYVLAEYKNKKWTRRYVKAIHSAGERIVGCEISDGTHKAIRVSREDGEQKIAGLKNIGHDCALVRIV